VNARAARRHPVACGRRPIAYRLRQAGFTYLGLLMAIVVMGLFLSVAARVWSTTEQRERETQLLFIGHAYRSAIGSYVAHMGHYPLALEDLLGTPDSAVPQRFLRQLYPDPITGNTDWSLIRSPGGDGIMGVASSSAAVPIKHANFDPSDSAFADATSYGGWQFVYVQRFYRKPANPKPP